MGYAKPIARYAVPYAICTLLHSLFYVINFMLIAPILNFLFNTEEASEPVTQMPVLEGFDIMQYFKQMLNYKMYEMYGDNVNVLHALMLLSIVLIVASLLSNFFRYMSSRIIENMKIQTLMRLRNDVYDKVMDLNVGYFNNSRKGDIMAKITSDVQVVQFCITNTLQVVFRDPFMILFMLGSMVLISWKMTVFSALFLPVVALVIGSIVKKLRHKAAAGQQTYAEMVSTLDESLGGIKIIKAYNAIDWIKDKFFGINRKYSKIQRSMAKRQQLAGPTSEFLGITAMCVLLLMGGKLTIEGSMDPGEFIAYLGIFSQITRPLRSFVDAFSTINQGIAAGERVLGLLDTRSTVLDKPDAKVLEKFNDDIEFRNVRFSYDTREVICGIDMTVKKGQTVALVGPSGGGKSTISDLIPRFHDVTAGEIIVDGHDIKDYTQESLRANIGVVSQDTILFNDTIENNLRMGKRNATMEEIIAAAKVANAHDFIIATDNGYQTNIGDRGMKLSGGQRQRLSIARAVLKNPDILILDEATSALDTESEKLVQDALDSLLRGRTSIVIAHRLSTIYNADVIYVIDEGHIVEQGTHEELTKKKGLYSKLVEMQHMA